MSGFCESPVQLDPVPPPHAIVRRMPWPGAAAADAEALVTREWLVTNGLGGTRRAPCRA